MPNAKRMQRINEAAAHTLAELLPEVKDPRLQNNMLSVVKCDVTRDLSYCKVYISVFGEHDPKQIKEGLRSASGFLRRELGARQRFRVTPELVFVLDDSIAQGAHISQLINSLNISRDDENDAE